MFISLNQHDQSVEGKNNNYIETNYYLVKNYQGQSRTWEFPKENKILLVAKKEKEKSIEKTPKNEIQIPNL